MLPSVLNPYLPPCLSSARVRILSGAYKKAPLSFDRDAEFAARYHSISCCLHALSGNVFHFLPVTAETPAMPTQKSLPASPSARYSGTSSQTLRRRLAPSAGSLPASGLLLLSFSVFASKLNLTYLQISVNRDFSPAPVPRFPPQWPPSAPFAAPYPPPAGSGSGTGPGCALSG